MGSSSMWYNMPTECQEHILSFLDTDDCFLLHSCILVSKAWFLRIVPLLYRSPFALLHHRSSSSTSQNGTSTTANAMFRITPDRARNQYHCLYNHEKRLAIKDYERIDEAEMEKREAHLLFVLMLSGGLFEDTDDNDDDVDASEEMVRFARLLDLDRWTIRVTGSSKKSQELSCASTSSTLSSSSPSSASAAATAATAAAATAATAAASLLSLHQQTIAGKEATRLDMLPTISQSSATTTTVNYLALYSHIDNLAHQRAIKTLFWPGLVSASARAIPESLTTAPAPVVTSTAAQRTTVTKISSSPMAQLERLAREIEQALVARYPSHIQDLWLCKTSSACFQSLVGQFSGLQRIVFVQANESYSPSATALSTCPSVVSSAATFLLAHKQLHSSIKQVRIRRIGATIFDQNLDLVKILHQPNLLDLSYNNSNSNRGPHQLSTLGTSVTNSLETILFGSIPSRPTFADMDEGLFLGQCHGLKHIQVETVRSDLFCWAVAKKKKVQEAERAMMAQQRSGKRWWVRKTDSKQLQHQQNQHHQHHPHQPPPLQPLASPFGFQLLSSKPSTATCSCESLRCIEVGNEQDIQGYSQYRTFLSPEEESVLPLPSFSAVGTSSLPSTSPSSPLLSPALSSPMLPHVNIPPQPTLTRTDSFMDAFEKWTKENRDVPGFSRTNSFESVLSSSSSGSGSGSESSGIEATFTSALSSAASSTPSSPPLTMTPYHSQHHHQPHQHHNQLAPLKSLDFTCLTESSVQSLLDATFAFQASLESLKIRLGRQIMFSWPMPFLTTLEIEYGRNTHIGFRYRSLAFCPNLKVLRLSGTEASGSHGLGGGGGRSLVHPNPVNPCGGTSKDLNLILGLENLTVLQLPLIEKSGLTKEWLQQIPKRLPRLIEFGIMASASLAYEELVQDVVDQVGMKCQRLQKLNFWIPNNNSCFLLAAVEACGVFKEKRKDVIVSIGQYSENNLW